MDLSSEDYFSYIRDEIAPLYFKVKTTIIEAEYWDPDQRAFIAPFNEVRNTFDHLMKCFDDKGGHDNMMKNLLEGKVHMVRAGYDIYEVFISNLAIYITKAIEKYPSEVISKVFPQYYTDIQPKLIAIKNNLTVVRSNKKIDSDSDTGPFETYEVEKNELKEIVATIDGHQPALTRETKLYKRRKWWNRGWTLIISIISALIVGILLAILFAPS